MCRNIVCHLRRVSENFEENKMSPGNLGIIFGPTLLRPLVSGDVSMLALLETSYQALLVEFLITHHNQVFGAGEQNRSCTPPPPVPTAPLPQTPTKSSSCPAPVAASTPQGEGPASRERPRSLEVRHALTICC